MLQHLSHTFVEAKNRTNVFKIKNETFISKTCTFYFLKILSLYELLYWGVLPDCCQGSDTHTSHVVQLNVRSRSAHCNCRLMVMAMIRSRDIHTRAHTYERIGLSPWMVFTYTAAWTNISNTYARRLVTYTYTHIRTYTRKLTHVHIPAMCKFTMSNRVSVIAHVLSLQMCVDLDVF